MLIKLTSILFLISSLSSSSIDCQPQYTSFEYPPHLSQALECVFTADSSASTYDCISLNATIRDRGQVFYTFDGNHIQNHTNADVNGIKISSQVCHYFPANLGKLLPLLKKLEISNSGLVDVDAQELSQMQNLQVLNLHGNRIEILNFGLLKFNRELTSIDFSDNFITIVASDLFNSLEKLKFADFNNNFCVKNEHPKENLRDWERELRRNCIAGFNRELAQPLWKIVEKMENLRSFG